jgi:putative transposase
MGQDMILTYKTKHGRDFGRELGLAKKVAEFAIIERKISSKDVKHIGLKSMIANQILRKYAKNWNAKRVNSVKLAVPSQGIKVINNEIRMPCLNLVLPIHFDSSFEKINQIELDGTYAYISCSYKEPLLYKPERTIGVDRNTKCHVLVASNIDTGKVLKLGKECNHVHQKYKHIRKSLQKKGKYSLVKRIKNRESRIVRNINHQISKRLVVEAQNNKAVIVLEGLKDIRRTAKTRRKERYSLNSWSFYQLQNMIEYKSKKYGVPVAYVEPQYTSQRCSRCGHIESNNRKAKKFCCVKCAAVENADVNAGFNIAHLYREGISQFSKESDLLKGSTDTPREEML